MRRRDLIIFGGAAVALPLDVGAQQKAIPVIGFLDGGSPEAFGPGAAAFRKGLGDAELVEGRNIRIETRWAEGHYDRLPVLAAELVRIPAVAIAATGITAALAAKAASATIPVVFHTGGDPVKAGLVSSLGRPGGNVTGIVTLGKILVPKQFDLLHELVPKADPIGFLVNPENGVLKFDISNAQEAARTKGLRLQVMEAGNDREIEAAFAALGQRQSGAIVVKIDSSCRWPRAAKAASIPRS